MFVHKTDYTENQKKRFYEAVDVLMSRGVNISQSLMKEVMDIVTEKNDVCGLQTKEKFINGNFKLFAGTPSMNLGTWFEYKATGGIPKDGKIPDAVKVKSGDYAEDYKRMLEHVKNFNDIISSNGILKVQAPYQVKYLHEGKIPYEINIDYMGLATKDIYNKEKELIIKAGEDIVLDIKTSGLIEDKWNDLGWELEMLPSKTKLIFQPTFYTYVMFLKTGVYPKFLFTLFSNKNEDDFKVIHINPDTDQIFVYLEDVIYKTTLWTAKFLLNGFPTNPSIKKCRKCPINAICSQKVTTAEIYTVHINEL